LNYKVGRLDEFAVTTGMLDIATVSAVALASLTVAYRYKRQQDAILQIRKIESTLKERVDVRKELKKRAGKLKGLPLVVITEQRHYTEKMLPILQQLGLSDSDYMKARKVANDIVREDMGGDNVYVWTLHGKKKAIFLITPPRVPRIILLHELGHIQSIKNKTSLARLDMSNIKRSLFQALDTLSSTYSKYGKYGTYREEKRAWDLAGVPESHPLRRAALSSYEHGGKLARLLHRAAAGLAAYPFVRTWLKSQGGKVEIPTPKFLKDEVGLIHTGLPARGIPGQMVEYV